MRQDGGRNRSRAERRCDGRRATVLRCVQHRSGLGGLDMPKLILRRSRLDHGADHPLLQGRLRLHPSLAAIVADMRDVDVVHNGLVVNIYIRDVGDVIYCAIVEYPAIAPISTFVAVTAITKAVVDSAVPADPFAPVTFVVDIAVPAVFPPPRRPKPAEPRRTHPGARHPIEVFIVIVPGPIAGNPNVTVFRAGGLDVGGQRRWGDPHRHEDADLRSA